MKTVTLYTDGACSGNPGPGGWAAILRYGAAVRELSGGEAETTNNRMELMGVIEGWKRRDGELKNAPLWQELDGLLAKHTVTAHWVKGHADNEYNNRCDALAVAERDKYTT